MCGIIGFYSKKVTTGDLEILRKAMIESRIRGKHASGIAWYNGKGNILSVSDSIPIDELVDKFGDFSVMVHDGAVSMIAHARYSTSNLLYNQPIVDKELAIVHNGVVTQSSPDTWESKYGYKCKTENDSELLLRAILNGDNIMEKFPSASISALTLDTSGNIQMLRNTKRPMWVGKVGEDGTIIASTQDILRRAGVDPDTIRRVSLDNDLQRRTISLWKKPLTA